MESFLEGMYAYIVIIVSGTGRVILSSSESDSSSISAMLLFSPVPAIYTPAGTLSQAKVFFIATGRLCLG